VVAGPDGLDPSANVAAIGVVESLQVVKSHVLTAPRREFEQGEAIARGRQALGERIEPVSYDIDDTCLAADPGIGG
jgi:hypothetical protein